MDKPIKLIKAFESQSHAENFQSGNIILRSLEYFRTQCESKNGDARDGNALNNSGGNSLVMPHFVLCMHDDTYVEKTSKYGNHKAVIDNPKEILDHIQNILKQTDTKVLYSDLQPVKYYDDNLDLHRIPPEKAALYKPEYSSDTSRSRCFKDDKEWRILITLFTTEPITHPNLECKYFRIKRLGRNCSVEELGYEEWLYSKYHNPTYIERPYRKHKLDEYYMEMHFKNIKFDSKLIK